LQPSCGACTAHAAAQACICLIRRRGPAAVPGRWRTRTT
jgi:hypothetical protein